MPATEHVERHFSGSAQVRDVVIGMADGLTVPFALAAGLSAAVETTRLVVTAGLAEIAAGAIAMGLGGYLAARSDAEHYATEEARERREIRELRDREVAEVRTVFADLGLEGPTLAGAVEAVTADPDRWTRFMMRFELGLAAVDPRRATISAATIGLSYVLGGLVPLSPYFVMAHARNALVASVALTALALLAFGGFKGAFTGGGVIRSAVQALVVGGLAAGAAFALATLFSG